MADIRDILSAARNALARSGVGDPETSPEYTLYKEILTRKSQTEADAAERATLYRRFDDLYYPAGITRGGADHWMNDPNLKVDGRVHISLNTPPPYVDIPADLQAIIPYINAVPDSSKKTDQEAADAREELFWAWWDDCDMDLNLSFISRIRSLYGTVAVKPYWDAILKVPRLSIISTPEHLRFGWGSNDFSRKDWALFCYGLSPQAVKEDYGLDVSVAEYGGEKVTLTSATRVSGTIDATNPPARNPTDYESLQVPVYDYWYKVPKKSGVAIWNAIYVGNSQVENAAHPEYDDIPYVYIPNGRIPGRPEGRSELYDIEQIFREIDERFSDYGQMMHKSMTEPPLQILGNDDYPGELSKSMMPGKDRPGMPGPGNRIEAVTPFLPAFQLSEYIKELKDARAERTGMSDLLLGLAGSRVAGSSKAINAELAMYVPRIGNQRELLYAGIKELWGVVGKLWSRKDPNKVGKILSDNYRLDIRAPEITVRDDVEQAQRTSILLQNGSISIRRSMDMNGVDNPSAEMDLIRQENTDAALNPSKVMTLIQEVLLARQAGFAGTQQAAQQGPAQVTLRDQALSAMKPGAAPPPGGSNAANQPGVTGTAENTPANALAPNGAPGLPLTNQTMLQGGKTTGRVLSEQKLVGQ